LATLLPRLGFAVPAEGTLDPRGLFEAPVQAVWVEIGFGGGEHLLAQATAHPEVGLIGVEPFLGGVARLLAEAGARGLGNVRVLVDDARLLLAALPDASIGRLFVLFPDPWPKLRHHKRRIVNPATLALMARVLAPHAELRLATDDPDYAAAMEAALAGEPRLTFSRLPERPADWPGTRYEAKALAAGRAPVWLRAERCA
jgi:tRNA (guanine-N7-)-methyltransferase